MPRRDHSAGFDDVVKRDAVDPFEARPFIGLKERRQHESQAAKRIAQGGASGISQPHLWRPSRAPTSSTSPWASSATTPTGRTRRAVRAVRPLAVAPAGNEGPQPGTIPTLGTASSALTVAAVRDDDRVAGFSSAGPAAVSGCSKVSVSSASG
jgi:hypothetical protein